MKINRFFILHAFIVVIGIAFILGSCSSDPRQDAISKIDSLEEGLVADTLGPVDKEKARQLVEHYVNFADNYSADSMAPSYLFKAADIAINTGMPGKSIMYFNRILNQYPGFEKVAHAMFLKAYVYENHMGNLGKAKSIYEEFIKKYPENAFADDAEVSIKYLGKSPEELIEEFEKNRDKEKM